MCTACFLLFFQAEDGIRDAQESRGLGDVYKRQELGRDIKTLDSYCAEWGFPYLDKKLTREYSLAT